jgi:3-methyladenine DNA glycosylase AlkC
LKKTGTGEDGLADMFIADYIERYGIDDFESAVDALEAVTPFVGCEFAVRDFLPEFNGKMIDRMKKWSKHENFKVRRLASECHRPVCPGPWRSKL